MCVFCIILLSMMAVTLCVVYVMRKTTEHSSSNQPVFICYNSFTLALCVT